VIEPWSSNHGLENVGSHDVRVAFQTMDDLSRDVDEFALQVFAC